MLYSRSLLVIYFIYRSVYMEKAMATHSSSLAWKIPWMEEPGRLQSMGSLRVRHDWATSLSLSTFMHWRRKHSSVLAWRIPETGEAGGLLSMGLHRVGHDWSDLAAAAATTILVSSIFDFSCMCFCFFTQLGLYNYIHLYCDFMFFTERHKHIPM